MKGLWEHHLETLCLRRGAAYTFEGSPLSELNHHGDFSCDDTGTSRHDQLFHSRCGTHTLFQVTAS
jgi:hypothetical protein